MMLKKGTEKIAVVIPSYRAGSTVCGVIAGIPDYIDTIIVVDDACPEGSGKSAEALGQENVVVVYHKRNQGVGGATISGYKKALELGCDIAVKMDSDGQMDPVYLPSLLEPLLENRADYTKGNRFVDFRSLQRMPWPRLLGNNLLSFLEKAYSGYWNIMDPTNGYTAIHRRILQKLELDKIAKNYFFESHMLLHLNLSNAVIQDLPIPARYEGEVSSFTLGKAITQFPLRLLGGWMKRIFLKYFIYDFNMGSVYILFGVPLFLWGIGFGLFEWIDSYQSGMPKTAGTIMVSALPLILGFEMLLQAIGIDIHNVPRKN